MAVYINPNSWAAMAGKASGNKKLQIVQVRKHAYQTVENALKSGHQIVKKNGVLLSSSYARALEMGLSAIERLPTELRREIFKYLNTESSLTVYLRGVRGPPTGINMPPVVRVNQTMRAEFLALAIESTTFYIHSGPGNARFQEWLGRTSLSLVSSYETGFDAVRSLGFSYLSRFHHHSMAPTAPNNDIELMLRCQKLESVSLVWHGEELVHHQIEAPKSVATLRKEYRLDRMLELHSLKHLRLVRHSVFGVEEKALKDLAEWFRSSIKDDKGEPPLVTID